MKRPRFTIASLLGLVVFLAVGLAALRAATDIWDSGVFGITLGLLLISVLLVIHRNEGRRAYWFGFAVFGWTYLALSSVPSIEARLPTTRGLAYIDSKVPGRMITITGVLNGSNGSTAGSGTPITTIAFSPDGRSIGTTSGGTVGVWDLASGRILAGPNGSTQDFLRIGHSLLALIMALLGACLSRYLHNSGGRSCTEEPNLPSPPAAGTSGS